MQQIAQKTHQIVHPRVSFTQTFESSQIQREQTFAINKSLARGINQNNSSLIVPPEHPSSFQEGSQVSAEQEIARIVLEYRSKYDRAKTDTLYLEKKIKNMKEEAEHLKQKQRVLAINKKECEKSFKQTENSLESLNQILEYASLRLDCSHNMQERIKKDIIYYKKHCFDSHLQLHKRKSDLRIHTSSSQRQQKLSLRCNNLLKSVQKTVHNNNEQRQKGVHTMQKIMGAKRQSLMKQQERGYFLQTSMQQALCSKLSQQREIIKIMLANKVVKKLLHDKMILQINKNKEASDAFTKIKQDTNIKSAKELVYNYLNKDDIYGDLLDSISSSETQINRLNLKKKQLQEQQVLLEHQRDEIGQRLKNIKNIDVDSLIILTNTVNNKLQLYEQFHNSIKNWSLCTIATLRGVKKTNIQYKNLPSVLNDCIHMIQKALQNKEERQRSIAQQSFEKQLVQRNIEGAELLHRNIRVKTVGHETVRQEQQLEYDLRDERDHLTMTRKAIKKQQYGRYRLKTKL